MAPRFPLDFTYFPGYSDRPILSLCSPNESGKFRCTFAPKKCPTRKSQIPKAGRVLLVPVWNVQSTATFCIGNLVARSFLYIYIYSRICIYLYSYLYNYLSDTRHRSCGTVAHETRLNDFLRTFCFCCSTSVFMSVSRCYYCTCFSIESYWQDFSFVFLLSAKSWPYVDCIE